MHEKVKNNYKYKFINIKLEKTNKIIIIFDIPEKERKVRAWLRGQIKLWEFTMIQKSVWLGFGPLPKEFYDRVDFLGIKECIKIFKVEKSTK